MSHTYSRRPSAQQTAYRPTSAARGDRRQLTPLHPDAAPTRSLSGYVVLMGADRRRAPTEVIVTRACLADVHATVDAMRHGGGRCEAWVIRGDATPAERAELVSALRGSRAARQQLRAGQSPVATLELGRLR